MEGVFKYSTCEWSLHFNWLMGVYFMLYHYIVIASSIKQFSDEEKSGGYRLLVHYKLTVIT